MLTLSKLGAPIAPFFMDRLYLDLVTPTKLEPYDSVHLSEFPNSNAQLIDKALEHKMAQAQLISSLVLSLRAKEKIKVRQPLQKIMIPINSKAQKDEIIAISDLIKHEVNVKEIELLEDASDILVKQIKPNFKVLGPRFGKDMKQVVAAIQKFDADDIQKIEEKGVLDLEINRKSINLQLTDVEISSQDIEGWLVANQGAVTVALDVTITEALKAEGIARELVNRIQNLRKDSGFEVTDMIDVFILNNEFMDKAVQNNLEYIKAETLTHTLHTVNELENGIEVNFDAITTKLLIKKYIK
jgi:isoleucyl-tRNA synthetase